MLGFVCNINPQNLINIVGATFHKIESFYFFLHKLTLILGVKGKLEKKNLEMFAIGPHIDFERDRSISLGSTFGYSQTEKKQTGR